MIGIIGIVLASAQLLLGCFKGKISAFTNGCFWLFTDICLVLAKGNREAWLYLPFLIIEVRLLISFRLNFGFLIINILQYDQINKLLDISGDLLTCCAAGRGGGDSAIIF